jgi:hypothetical protein
VYNFHKAFEDWNTGNSKNIIYVKYKGKVHHRTSHKGPERE